MNRPALTSLLTADEFAAWYWLKEERVLFCREHSLTTVGLKHELEARIAALLEGRTLPPGTTVRRAGVMPDVFTLNTIIGDGWRCTPALGKYFKSVLRNGFHFNAEMRSFIHNGSGKTLGRAVACYRKSVQPGRMQSAIPQQLEYNRHFREYFRQHPGATRDAAIAAWWAKRSVRK